MITFDLKKLNFPIRRKQQIAFTALDNQKWVLTVLPTGYGKTLIGMYLAGKAGKFIIVAPLKALVEEQKKSFGEYFDVLAVSGDYRQNKKIVFDPGYDGYCMTYEMVFQLIINPKQRTRLFPDISAVIIDEAHLIGDRSRGPILESTIYLLEKFCPHIQMLLLSATVGNPQKFATHFNTELILANENERPVRLQQEIWDHARYSKHNEKIDVILNNLHMLIEEYPKNDTMPNMLIFCGSRGESEKLCASISELYPHITADFHHAGRTREQRVAIEDKFRNGDLNMLFCTPTLAMGINVPADICVITSVMRFNRLLSQKELLKASELIQMLGRAGRVGVKTKLFEIQGGKKIPYGRAIVFVEFDKYTQIKEMMEHPIEVTSQIPTKLKYILLTWISSGIHHRKDLENLYRRIFIEHPDLGIFHTELEWLKKYKFFTMDKNGNISLRHIGQIVARFAIHPRTVLFIQRIKAKLNSYEANITPAQLFALFMSCDEFVQNIRINEDMDKDALSNAKYFVNSTILHEILYSNADKWYLKRMAQVKKGFALTFDSYLQQRYKLDPYKKIRYLGKIGGDAYLLREQARRIIAATVALGRNWRYGKVLNALKNGIELSPPIFDSDIVELVAIDTIGVKSAVLISESGIKDKKTFLDANPHYLAQKLTRIKEKKNADLRKYHAQGGKKIPLWRGISEKTLEKMQNEAAKNKTPKNNKNKGKPKKTLLDLV
nr:DEAD/DEAH box helicase [Candidatus Prometheoarchaeum syntrophicum]